MLEFLQCKGTKKEWIVSRLGLKKRVRSDVWTALFGYQGWLLTLFHFLKYNHNCISVYYIMLGTNMAIL